MTNLELPEIETLKRDLEREFLGRRVKETQVLNPQSVQAETTADQFGIKITGAKIDSIGRNALHIIVGFDNDYSMIIELGDRGRLEKASTAKDELAPDVVAVIHFTQGASLRIADGGAACFINVVHDDDRDTVLLPPAQVGLDPLAAPLSWIDFGRTVTAYKQPLITLLTDPTVFVGIGDIYSNEILFDAGLRYDRSSDGLSTQEIRRLYRSLVGVLHDAIKHRGTSLEDRPFHDLLGESGDYGEHLAVYEKTGELSPRSREPIQKVNFKQRRVFYCNTQV